jgi:NitT/TauT family transport system ATP-binding protein/nitrate/nitrite transport system substrate-binding protein
MIKPEKNTVTLGFVPLTDSAPLIIAKELGFFEHWGLDVELLKQNSWATLRDKLHLGALDAAQMLAPMPIASTLGLGNDATHIITPLILSLNGNAITLSELLYQEVLNVNQLNELALPMPANLLQAVVKNRKDRGADKLTFATVFPYSCHHYQLRDWLQSAGLTQQDVDIVIVPPVNMVSYLQQSYVDGFCVGGPWNAKAVRTGNGITVATSSDIWIDSPEKVLGLKASFAKSHPHTVIALCAALKQACDWLDSVSNRFEAARLLCSAAYLDETLDVIAPSLIGSCLTHQTLSPRNIPSYNQFSNGNKGSINQPQPVRGEWLVEQMLRAGQLPAGVDSRMVVNRVFREDIYQQVELALAEMIPINKYVKAL